ncbi:phosphoenolpyruvate--protein phosphotransferase [Limnohabitans sp. JirII-29]|jgi:phosphotransferase system enzyme I (PtsI)|uniref:phosphoenolpyruvate--protein phosphotransferase n=1 Tax=unclassified Limnohabitans TaxID=2626134 RepID=UPI000C1F4CA8|nr:MULTISPECIES: phosphoenolpyruvate--protein phosphotransferase [unclassified Limnohabitans]PIT74610.1 phosphoenolpyruvate--protein phosphotransferase [Limnohabitans sp. JirII-31]PUE29005.1 phosphoenolpyruvate--protein phosphotransferase [Limnohabitans sp. JirII-29]
MTFAIHGLAVARGIAIGRAVLVASSRVDVAHYFIEPTQVDAELRRLAKARMAVQSELQTLHDTLPKDAPPELAAILEVHLMLLQDSMLAEGVTHWVKDRLYNAEWALTSQLDVVARQFDEMDDPYLRERKGDLEQVVERLLRHIKGVAHHVVPTVAHKRQGASRQQDLQLEDSMDVPLVLVAHDLSPADMLQFKQSVFTGFVTDVGGKTSHTAIVARSLDIPAVVGARTASQLVRQDDWIIIDGDAGVVIVNPSPIILAEYGFKQRQAELERERLSRLRHTPAVTLDGQRVELLANIEMPEDSPAALDVGAVGVGLFRSEFLFMGRVGSLPDEQEQYLAYRRAVEGMKGLPVTIRTVDIGADKPLDRSLKDESHLNPALGLRAIRWSLADPAMFLTQLRAILRAAAHGQVHLLIPMLAHAREIKQTFALLEQARAQLDARGEAFGPLKVGAMIEVPAAALSVKMFLRYFDFLSIGTNDLIQYTLAIDRADESVAHLYDPLHPAVLRLVADTMAECRVQGKSVSVCGEMAGDPALTRLLLGLGLRSFSMHPTQILAVKQEVLRADTSRLQAWAQQVLASEEPAELMGV